MSRRGNNEGNIRKRDNGRWEARLPTPGGRKSFYGKTRAEAMHQMEEAKRFLAKGLPLPDDRLTVREYLTDWLESINVRPSTWQRYKELVTLHLLPALGDWPIARLTPQQVKLAYAGMKQKVSETTVHHVHAVLHKALKDALRGNIVPHNVTEMLEPPKMPHHEIASLSPDQANQFLEAIAGDRLEALYALALTCGAREGELLALKWADVHLDDPDPWLHVRATLHYLHGQFTFDPPKSKRGERDILLHPLAIAALSAHRTRQKEERLQQGARWNDAVEYRDLVFTNGVGRPIEASNFLKRWYYPLLEKAGLPRVTFHALRHSAASLLLNEGTPPMTVSRMLGHATAAFTMDRYGHVGLKDQEVANAKMSRALSGRGNVGVKNKVI
jgi:integrase